MTKADRAPPAVPRIATVAEFFAQALAIEEEASERYAMLADQMEVHNNREIAAIFRKMANIEALHREEIARRAGDRLVAGTQAEFDWTAPEGPEAVAFDTVHYLMNGHQALRLPLHNEIRAASFFEQIAASTPDPDVRELALEMARDEREHIHWVEEWLQKFPDEANDTHDPDPPVYSE